MSVTSEPDYISWLKKQDNTKDRQGEAFHGIPAGLFFPVL